LKLNDSFSNNYSKTELSTLSIDKMDESTVLKFENLLNKTLNNRQQELNRNIDDEDDYDCFNSDSTQSFDIKNENNLTTINQEIKIDELLSSKSSINSEEGYYSNRDSSSTVSTLVNNTDQPHYSSSSPSTSSSSSSSPSSTVDKSIIEACKLNMDYSRFSHNFYENDNENDYYSSQIDSIFKSPIISLNNQTDNNTTNEEYKTKLIRNKFTSLNSLKEKYQYLNNNCVSEIKLFDKNSTSPRINNDQIENTDSFRVNIKELISKFEQK
jgi:hypothetical protein